LSLSVFQDTTIESLYLFVPQNSLGEVCHTKS